MAELRVDHGDELGARAVDDRLDVHLQALVQPRFGEQVEVLQHLKAHILRQRGPPRIIAREAALRLRSRARMRGEAGRNNAERRLVWEIGAGWGGFPYQFKTVCPNVTYVITDFPELFLYSATYLMTAFPGAKVAFWGEDSTERLLERWREYDFIFLSNTSLAEMTLERLDLTINMVSFQEMTDAQADAYVARAHALNCPFVYSLNRDKSAYNPEITSVSEVISRYYWPREVAVLPVPYTKMMDELPSAHDYKHIIGWRRVKV